MAAAQEVEKPDEKMDEKPVSMKVNYEKDYSIVICAYNPDERILTRCLKAVAALDTAGLQTEVILTDNNSRIPIRDLSYVKACTKDLPSFHLLEVPEQGVKYARMAAIEKARGKFIVYIDSDNEPAPDYLQELKKLNHRFPQVGAWGPGEVNVEFMDGIDKKIEAYARHVFQERHDTTDEFANEREWQPCYPYGTGLCTYTFLLKEYIALARQGAFTQPGRQGGALTSGEDTQMVLLCIRKGYSAGVSPSLRLSHLIPRSRANRKYLQRITWGTGICYETCMLEVFPERRPQLLKRLMSESKFSRQALKRMLNATWHRNPMKQFELVRFLSLNAGIYAALGKPLPATVAGVIKFLNLA
ncbi:glycosyltransferase family 2 protein [Chitinophaga lutea]|uniref:Glycosyltransferase family 2 protein n=2 Tax=Chitinophaga lutea TaxID=2488634 RepID=A0A3N4PCM1_9BACT|nr:glycosyltransferase family 2 protein [Chitinophaga lutea]